LIETLPKTLPFIVPRKPFGSLKRRLPERKYMTLVAGFSGAGGLVLFADSQETKQGYGKKSVDKIEFWSSGKAQIAFLVGGAGSAAHIDNLVQQLGAVVRRTVLAQPGDGLDPIFAEIELMVSNFFKEHIWSRSGDKPELELLFALQPEKGRPELFHVADGLVTYIPAAHKTIGVGCYLADFLLEKLDDFGQHEAEMIAVAAYVLKEVKANVDGVGLRSTIWLLRTDGTREQFEQEDLEGVERFMERFNEIIRVAFDSAFDTTIHRSLPDHIANEINAIRKEYGDWLASLDKRRMEDVEEYFKRKQWLRGA
jgi:hypothetical protein